MYGKIFETMYEGSMVGAGAHVFAVWGYCISKADPEDHIVRLNTAILSTAIGESVDRIVEAIGFLCSKDDDSTNTDHDGRRLLHLGGLSYLVVSHEHYRNMKSNEEQRAYFRDAKRKQRAKKKDVKDSQRQSQDPASVSASVSASDSVSDEREIAKRESGERFETAWAMFGRYGVEKKAVEYWAAIPESEQHAIVKAIPAYVKCLAVGRSKSQFEGWINPCNRKWDMDWDQAYKDLLAKGQGNGQSKAAERRAEKASREFPEDIKPRML